jgi:hypothetical protein
MLISSSRCPSLYRTSFKETHRYGKVAKQQSKIGLREEPAKSLTKARICHIQKELMRLDDNPELSNYLAHTHYLFFNRSTRVPMYGAASCQDSVSAIIQRNLFDHKLFRDIDSLERCALELQDKEEGTFSVRMSQRFFVADTDEIRQFQGHSFIIVKMIEGDSTFYLIAQSFVEKYSLKTFILKNEMIFDSYAQLNEKVLEPLKLIVNKSGEWSDKECRAHFELTGVFPGWLIGFSPPNHNLLEATRFGRSTNFHIEGKKSISLGKFVNGKLEIPDEWKQIMKEFRE